MTRAFVPHVITNDSALGGSIIEKSLRFRHGVNWSLQRTFSSNYSTWTASLWFKRGRPGDYQYLFAFGGSGLALNQSEGYLYIYNGTIINSTAQFRDHTGWYHVVMKQSLGTAYTYVNGVLTHNGVSGFNINSGQNCAIGRYPGDHEFDGYMADIHLVCGQALEPTSFGYTDSQTGIWRPKKYTGTYDDDEGFHLEFKDASSASALGTDTSGKGHNFSSSNFSVSTNVWHMNDAGSAHSDSSTDSPTNDFCTLNPLDKDSNIGTLAEGNLRPNTNSSGWCGLKGTMAVSSGKWYYEFKTSNNNIFCGWCSDDLDTFAGAPQDNNSLMSQGSLVFCDDGRYHLDTGGSGNRVSYSTSIGSDVLGCAIDLDNNTAQFYKNGSGLGVINISSSKLATKFVHPYLIIYTSGGTYRMNFGQKAFAYTPPAGYKAWSSNNKVNLNTPIILKPQKHFDVVTYTGNGSNSHAITGLDFKPDLVWIKCSSSNKWNILVDSVRGTDKNLSSNSDTTEFTETHIPSFNSNGFTVADIDSGTANENGFSYVAWSWKAGSPKTPTSGSVNFDGANGTNLHIANNSDIQIGSTSNWTIEFWLKRTAAYSDYDVILGKGTSGTYEWFIEGFADGSVDFLYSNNGSTTWSGQLNIIPSQVLDRWYHIAIVRNGSGANSFKMYVDGTQTYQSTAFDIYAGTANLDIGGYGGASAQDPPVVISNLRIVKGTSVYTSNFTPPNSPLTNITNTKLLCCQSSTSATAATVTPNSITANGGCTPKSVNPFDAFTVDGVSYQSASAAGLSAGSIDITAASVNKEAGFSIITFNGNGSAGSTISHGLGRKPKFIIVKRRTGGNQAWFIRLGSFNSDYNGRYVRLQDNGGASGTDTNVFPNTEPTSTVISLGADAGVNASGSTYLCYCWAEIPGFSKFHLYKGNGSTEGPYVHLGFRPKMFIFKRLGGNSGWNIVDTSRSPVNPNSVRIEVNTPAAQDSNSAYHIDILNDGIKVRNSNSEWNASERYAIMAWAEQPGINPYGTETNSR